MHLPLLHANVHVMIGELDRIVCEVLPTAGEEGQRGLPVMAACGPGHSTGHVASNTLQVRSRQPARAQRGRNQLSTM